MWPPLVILNLDLDFEAGKEEVQLLRLQNVTLTTWEVAGLIAGVLNSLPHLPCAAAATDMFSALLKPLFGWDRPWCTCPQWQCPCRTLCIPGQLCVVLPVPMFKNIPGSSLEAVLLLMRGTFRPCFNSPFCGMSSFLSGCMLELGARICGQTGLGVVEV